jgi:PPIC-type PPIASE domain
MLRLPMIMLLTAMSAAQAAKPSQSPTSPAQTTPAPRPAASPEAPVPGGVADTQTVITIHGLCPHTAPTATKTAAKKATPATSTGCATVVTKAQLDKLIGLLNQTNMTITPQIRKQFATSYVELLTYAAAAEKAGTDDAKFADIMRFIRLRTLVSVYRAHLQEQYSKPPEKDIESHYNANKSKYEEVKLSRLFIPAKNTAAQDKDDWEKKAAQLATDLHDRAAKGEDMEKLQKEAYTTLGLTIAPPSTNFGERRRGGLPPPQEQELFALKPGEVSKVDQQAAGYTIYKVESRDFLPLDKVKDEISREIGRENLEAKNKEINAGIHADLNESYFGPATPPPSMVPPNTPARVIPPSSAAPPAPAPVASPAPAQPAASPAVPKN